MSRPDVRAHKGKTPRIAASAYIDPAAVIIGDVEIGEDSSVWPCAVIRGDVHWIKLGRRTNIQDGSVLHGMLNEWPVELGDNVTIGHSVTLHGCSIASRVLVGMGCVILNGVKIGSGCIIAAGTLIPERTVVPAGTLFMGHPGKVRRELTPEELLEIDGYAERYIGYKNDYRAEAEK
jgi:carbonic anhydrase/acetyltransferase-like protein (isoleucine patch superfamily)